jgi:acyl-coenzyme A thioesterase PaaI-like protein
MAPGYGATRWTDGQCAQCGSRVPTCSVEPAGTDAAHDDSTAELLEDLADRDWTNHFVGSMAVALWAEGGITHGKAVLRAEMWQPGTEIPRLGILATFVDLVAGMRPTGAINPTVDLRITLVSRPPSVGNVYTACEPVKDGRRLFVGELHLHTGDPATPFAHATVTFMNQLIPGVPFTTFEDRVGPLGTTFDDLLEARFPMPGTVEMDAHPAVSNGPGGTIQGGVQSVLAQIAAERALEHRGRFSAVDLHIQFLNRVRTQSVTATAQVLPDAFDQVLVRVPIVEAGADGRIVSLVTVVCREL